MSGTIVITGATGSLAIEAIQQILSSYPSVTIIGTVRNSKASPKSSHLLRLEELMSHYPNNISIKNVNLNSINEVREFADEIAGLVESKKLPPIRAIICNAFTWSLNGQKFSSDRLESTFQVNHLAHFLMTLKLVRSMDRETGRIILLGSEVHDPENVNPLSKLGAELPADDNLDSLIKPGPDKTVSEHDMGWRRYANSKLANVMFMRSLNERLLKTPGFNKITVTAMDPGGLVDSRAHDAQRIFNRILFRLFAFLLPIINLFTNKLRSNANSAKDVVGLALDQEFTSRRGYFNGRTAQSPARASEDDEKCEALWKACWQWTGMKDVETCVSL
ncbi:unnamed protein product [Penicillium salamii]|uniref:3beta-hydroxysteroid 3-dehydrogenase n=1 Tax=Penicillium salamii TaxID=1612424 RepID=A0A9W4JED3_9EURO|nr:unnamed protein product [Penicillium salamii]